MPVVGVKEWKNHLRVLRLPSISKIRSDFQNWLQAAVSGIWADFEITIFGHETWNLKKGPEVAYGPSFYPRGSKLSSFSLYRQRFSR